LARLAFPGLVGRAKWFKWAITAMILLLFFWLMATCMLSWDVAAGKAIYARVEVLRTESAQYEAKIKALESDSAKRPVSATAATAGAADVGVLLVKTCNWERVIKQTPKGDDYTESLNNVDEISLCNQLARTRLQYAVSRQDLAGWLGVWRYWLAGLTNSLCRHNCTYDPNSAVPQDETNEQWGSILLEVLAGAVLPLFYGLLGAGAAVVRDLWGKMKDSLLSPRDLTLALGQLALGAVVGGCIGLFVYPPGAQPQDATGLLVGPVPLSASALSFIAGFGVEGVFVALENLIKRVFNITQPTKAT
jgi:hypothetical protein